MDPIDHISICGLGDVGQAIKTLIPKYLYKHLSGYDPNVHSYGDFRSLTYPITILHYTVPMVDFYEWISEFSDYLERLVPKIVIVESTVIPAFAGIVDLIDDHFLDKMSIFYSPIRATEQILTKQLKHKQKYLAQIHGPEADLNFVKKYYEAIYPAGVVIFNDPKALMLGKLFETAQFGVNIALVRALSQYCQKEGISFIEANNVYMQDTTWAQDYLARSFEPQDFIPRPIFRPGKIGGKCVMQNISLMQRYLDSFYGLWKWVEKVNEGRMTWSMGQVELDRDSVYERRE